MIKNSRPFTDIYMRYILSWLLFGLFGGIYLWQWGWLYGVMSIVVAFVMSFGLDFIVKFIIKSKVKAMVSEKPLVMVNAIRLHPERRGYLVVTNRFILFVPVFRKIKTVFEADHIVRQESDRLVVDITAKFRNNFRVFSFAVISTRRLLPLLEDITGESLPYKYDRLEKHSL